MQPASGKYARSLRVLHWLIAALVLVNVALALGSEWWESSIGGSPFPLHKSIGVTVLGLVLLRIVERIRHKTPKHPDWMKHWEHRLAHLNHYGLYLLLLLMPLTGYTMSAAGGRGVQWFGIELPILVPRNQALASFAHDAHEILAWVLITMIALHLAGVAKHLLIDRRNILQRIT